LSNEHQDGDEHPLLYDGKGAPINFETRVSDLENKASNAEDRDNEYKKRQIAINSWVAWFTLALVITSMLSGGVAIWQGHISQKAANAATEAVAESKRQFNLNQLNYQISL
jgi:cytoskeletal protein RodZ